jgi:sugar phosphate isomerase/epimerase
MELKLAMADYSFPLLEWKHTFAVARAIGLSGMDIALFEQHSHLCPADMLASPSRGASHVSAVLRDSGMGLTDIFGIPSTSFDRSAINDPDPMVRRQSAEYFYRLLEFAVRCNSPHLTILPGVSFPNETYDDSLKRAADELEWRADLARKLGVQLGIEAHFGSLVATPERVLSLLRLAPTLTLTLDPAHFVYQGVTDEEILPLVARTSHVQVRCARPGRLQAPLKENTVNFQKLLESLKQHRYSGWISLEYVWFEWEHCNEVDNVSETILLKNLLQSLFTNSTE